MCQKAVCLKNKVECSRKKNMIVCLEDVLYTSKIHHKGWFF